MSHILLTGAAGFVGATVVRDLLAAGHSVVGLDNLEPAYDVRLKHWRLKQLCVSSGFGFREVDIRDRSALANVWESSKPFDAVIHLAATAGVRESVIDPWSYVVTNVHGTLNVLHECQHYSVPRLVFASSSSVYGQAAVLPCHEEVDTNRPLSPYGASKKAAELLCHTYHHLYGIHAVVFRFFTVYGPAGRPEMSLMRFMRSITLGEPITIYGDGQQTRDFTYVDDVARGVVAALDLSGHHVINLGSSRPIVLREALSVIERICAQPARVRYEPLAPTDIPHSWAAISRAGQLLSWQPQVSFEEGITRMADWFRVNEIWLRSIRF